MGGRPAFAAITRFQWPFDLVDGNPLENLDLVADSDENFVVIVKHGKIYKNTVK